MVIAHSKLFDLSADHSIHGRRSLIVHQFNVAGHRTFYKYENAIALVFINNKFNGIFALVRLMQLERVAHESYLHSKFLVHIEHQTRPFSRSKSRQK